MIKQAILALMCVLLLTTAASAQTYIRLWPNGNDGNITLVNQSITVANAREQGTVGIQVTNTFVGTLVPQCTVDGTNWQAIRVTPTNSTTTVASMTGTGLWTGSIAGCKSVRVTSTAWSSGTATITINTFAGGGGSGSGGGAGGGGGDITINGSTPDLGTGNSSASTLRVIEADDSPLNSFLALMSASAQTTATATTTIATNLNADAVHDNPVTATGPQIQLEAKDFDGSALPNNVSAEGDAVRAAGSLSGVTYTMLVNEDGSKELGKKEDDAHVSGDYGVPVWCRRSDTLGSSAGTDGDYATFNCGATTGALFVASLATATSGAGATPTAIASTASTNSISVKGSAGNVYGLTLVNTTSTLYYIRFYDSSSAPTCSSATGYLFSLPIPASTTGAGGFPWPNVGVSFTTGIGYCITGGAGSTDNTNAATGVFGFISWK